jgi:sensor histidine kinase YesM
VDERVQNVKIPCTIIQPIIENAFIHGLQNLERDGAILLFVRLWGGSILIEVEDNGEGLTEKQVEALLTLGSGKSRQGKHVTGIGISNVIERLQLYYNIAEIKDVIEIESTQGHGTRVTLKIPYVEDVVQDDETVDCG